MWSMNLLVVVIGLFVLPSFQFVTGMPGKRQQYNAQTTFLFDSCDANQTAILKTAQADALILANAAIDKVRDLSVGGSSVAKDDYRINFGTRAALEFWGPDSQNTAYQEFILDTYYRAIQSYPGTGFVDWWKNRYVYLTCNDLRGPDNGGCKPGAVAYTESDSNRLLPWIVFCQPFFDGLQPHGARVAALQSNADLRQNLRNLRSQATTMLHEWLHIKGFSAEVCLGGCIDVYQTIGGVRAQSYKTGAAKLLASKSPKSAANNNDNYAYFAMARFIEKTWNTYPRFPRAWNTQWTPDQNKEFEKTEPGYSDLGIDDLEEDSGIPDPDTPDTSLAADTPLLNMTDYPVWYWEVLLSPYIASSSLYAVEPPAADLSAFLPSFDAVVCNTTSASPLIQDCVHAFVSANSVPGLAATKGKSGGYSWESYVEGCALEVSYTADWTDSCTATVGDVRNHAAAIFQGCSDGGLGTVGGSIPFAIDNCPGNIALISTADVPEP